MEGELGMFPRFHSANHPDPTRWPCSSPPNGKGEAEASWKPQLRLLCTNPKPTAWQAVASVPPDPSLCLSFFHQI